MSARPRDGVRAGLRHGRAVPLAIGLALASAPLALACGASEGTVGSSPQGLPAPVVSLPSAGAGTNAASSTLVVSPQRGGVDGGAAEPSPDEIRIAKMLKKVSAARKLAPKHGVPGVTLSRTALLDRVKLHVSREVPKEAIKNEGLTMKLLGLVPTDFDYEAETFALLEAQLAGYYEPADGSMYMAADLDDDNARATLAHELVHALQDQYWDLDARSKYKPSQGDLSATTSALAEGDATSAMFDVLLAGSGRKAIDLPEEIFSEQIIQSVSQGPSARAPHAMRAALVAPYVHGTLFVHALRRRGGWDLVNRAWQRPPVSTEQILHPEKWESHEAPLIVSAPTFAALGAGFVSSDTDTFGELGVRLTFAEWMDESLAVGLSLHWGGDRATLVANGDEIAMGWRIVYDAEKSPVSARATAHGKTVGERAFTTLTGALDARMGRPRRKDTSFACFDRGDIGPLGVLSDKGAIVIVAGPAKTATTGRWTNAGDCATSEKWAKEIAAAAP
jgi:hypothetical protein